VGAKEQSGRTWSSSLWTRGTATSLRGALEGVGPDNRDIFLGPEMERAKRVPLTFLGPKGTRFARCHFRAQKSLDFLWALKWQRAKRVPLTFLGPNDTRFAHCHFRAQKSLDFQGPPLPMPLVMMLHASKPLRTALYKQQAH
jgi:hypothetical protein